MSKRCAFPDTSRVDGLLGLSYLRNFKVEIDFKKGILTLNNFPS